MKLKIRLIFIIIAVFFIDITVYAYTEYKVGDVVSYNGMEFYVIKDSSSKDDSVTMLKAEPLTVDEVNTYGGVGTANNHVNVYNASSGDSYYRTAYDQNGYGGMAYYSSPTCGYNGTDWVYDECTTDYEQSEVKYVVDAWKAANAPAATEARLITYEELLNNLGYENNFTCTGGCFYSGSLENIPNWVYNRNYYYWTMSPNNDSASYVWYVSYDGGLSRHNVNYYGLGDVVRPVIILKKTTLGDEDESIKDDNTDESIKDENTDEVLSDNKNSVDKKETTTKVKVENTYMSQTLIVMIIGFISICSGVIIYYLIKNKVISRR